MDICEVKGTCVMKLHRNISCLVLAAGIGLAGCSNKENPVTQTAGTPSKQAAPGKVAETSAPAPSVDLSTPKAALKAFGEAIKSGNLAAAKAVTISDEKANKILEAFVPTFGAMKRLSDTAVKKYGEAGKSIGNDSKGGFEITDDLDKANIVETGDTATATMKDSKEKEPIKLKKIDGQWKVDFVSMMGEKGKTEDVSKIAPIFAAMTKAANESADEIEAGKYKTADEAKKAVNMKMMSALLGGFGEAMKAAGKDGANPFGGQGNPFGGSGGGNPFGGAPGSGGGK
jgi:hypothetical protein